MKTMSSSAEDYCFLEGLFLTTPLDKYSCPICLSAVQREAFLTQCCGGHFCRQCISRMVKSGKPCPMCKASPLMVFPNKERQREINSQPVCCPTALLEKGKMVRGPIFNLSLVERQRVYPQLVPCRETKGPSPTCPL